MVVIVLKVLKVVEVVIVLGNLKLALVDNIDNSFSGQQFQRLEGFSWLSRLS